MLRVLASASPRRRELMEKLGVEFCVMPAQGEESVTTDDPEQLVMDLAEQKAQETAESVRKMLKDKQNGNETSCFILGADTVVSCGGEILGKPENAQDAARMLSLLSGNVHQVYTGVCMLYATAGEVHRRLFFEGTDVEFYPLSEKEIASYIKSGEPFDKAGAYGIQGKGALLVKRISGDYFNVVGLPIARVYREICSSFPEVLK